MKVDTLEKLYEDQMSSLRNGQEQFLDLLPALVNVTTHAQLRNSIRDLIPHLREQISRLERYLPDNGVVQQANDSPGMKGLIGEGHAFLERASDPDIIDAGLVTLFQRILHYSMAGYAALRTFASLLGREEEAQGLMRSLNEQAEAEEGLTRIALEVVNIDALSASTR
jgi:ferritin-like metal-binding protein YciE